jgi:ABC-type branched-subunit amino acid transport system substrate-binding protein
MYSLKVVSIIIFFLPFFSSAKEPISICLTGRIEINLPSYREGFVNAANLAYKHSEIKRSVVIKNYFYDDRPLSPIAAYKKMLKNNCSAVIGFEYLSDLLLVVKTQGVNKIPIFTSYSSTLGRNKLPENIFVFMPSYHFLSNTMINFLRKKFGHLNHLLLITEINRDSMKQYRQAYVQEFKKRKIKYETFEILENDKNLISKLNNFLKNKGRFDYVFLLSGVIAATKIINELNNETTTFVGTENYGSSSSPSLYVRLTNKNIQSYFIRNYDSIKRSKLLKKFEDSYEKEFDSKPLSLSAYTYDATRIILNSIQKYNNVNINNILNINYIGASGIKIKNKIFYRSQEYIILKMTPSGYQYVESITD